MYAQVRDRIKTELTSVKYFAATSDLWSSDGTLIPYINYTIHFLNEDWQLQNQCLQNKFVPEDHTGNNIADAMEETLTMWDLKAESQVCITTDIGANVINAAKKWNGNDCLASVTISIWELLSHWQMTQGVVEHLEYPVK